MTPFAILIVFYGTAAPAYHDLPNMKMCTAAATGIVAHHPPLAGPFAICVDIDGNTQEFKSP